MKEFKVTISYQSFDPIQKKNVRKQLSGEFVGATFDHAEDDAKEFYAQELGTMPEEIHIVSAFVVGEG